MAVLPDQVREVAARWPDAVAYRVLGAGDDRVDLTFEDWRRSGNRVARALVGAGVEPGDRVALLLRDDEAVVHLRTYTGVHQAGAIAVLVNVRYSPAEVATLLEHAEPTVVFVSRSEDDLVSDLPSSVRLVVRSGREWDEVVGDHDDDIQVPVADDAPADVVYTGGTTGRPKGVLSRHHNTMQTPIGAPDAWQGTAWIHGSPLTSLAGQSFVHAGSALGMSVVYLPPPFDPQRWLRAVEEEEDVVAAYLAPVMVEQLLSTDGVEAADLSGLAIVRVGSAPIAPATLRRFDALLPNATPNNSYTLTELGTGYTELPDEEFPDRAGSVGRPVEPFEVRVVDPDSGEGLPRGEVGEVLARHPRRREYFRAPELEAETFEDGWMRTGDRGYVDDGGCLWIVGRTDDVIIRGGYNVDPADPENALHEIDAVQEAAVVGVPHDELGEDVVAFVVLRPGSELAGDDVLARLSERLGEPDRPSRVAVVDALPRNPAGKVLKRELRARAAGEA